VKPPVLAAQVLRWQRSHGRRGLPWQESRDPYCVWLSEVMLQQTQVATVLGYYVRFLERFPHVRALAAAPLDEVLALWSGLGYYSRARHLHRCAQEVTSRFGGEFPRSARELQTLPGIGRSTAAAIAAFCFAERAAILDGNVRRVLARAVGFGKDLAEAPNERELWTIADAQLPTHDLQDSMPRYTQGLMDLGATVCLPRNPSCLLCPLQAGCVAAREGRPEAYPLRTRRLKRTSQSLWLLRANDRSGAVWLEKRPTPGVWAGLYCLPLFDSREALQQALPAGARGVACEGDAFVHVLTHKDLHLHPVRVEFSSRKWRNSRAGAWFGSEEWPRLGLPSPVRRLLESG
jgi:A/G-specific adenine glycosylase